MDGLFVNSSHAKINSNGLNSTSNSSRVSLSDGARKLFQNKLAIFEILDQGPSASQIF